MDAQFTRSRLIAIALASLLTWPASAGSLYKFVDSGGAIVFTDVPPPSDARDARTVAQATTDEATGVTKSAGTPHYEITEVDEAVARANARIDLAEHNLAVARQGLWSPRDGLSLVAGRRTASDWSRVQFYKDAVQVARQQLMDLLRDRQASPVLAAR